MASHKFEEDSLDTLANKGVKGEAWIKTFWDLDIEDTSRIDRSPPKFDYKEYSIDNDLDSSILTLTDISYELNLIDKLMAIIHPELIDWDQQDPPHLDTFHNDDAVIEFFEL